MRFLLSFAQIRKSLSSGEDQVKPFNLVFSLAPLVFILAGVTGVQAQQELDRTILPIPAPGSEIGVKS
jgi:hypothetical protein